MRKEITETIKQKKNIFFCDVCGANMGTGDFYGSISCRMCGKHLCRKHIIYENDGTDYSPTYCQRCLDIGQKYRSLLDAALDEYDGKVERIEEAWRKECLENE